MANDDRLVNGAGQIGRVEDQHDGAVAEQRRAPDARYATQVCAERFHDRVAAVHNLVYCQGDTPAGKVRNQHGLHGRRGRRPGEPERLGQIPQRVRPAVHREHPFGAHETDRRRMGPHDLHDGAERQPERLATGAHEENAGDREGHRDPHRDRRAGACLRCHVDSPAQPPDLRLDDVHADAAPGHLGHLLGGAEPWLEDESVHRVGAHGRGCGLGDKAPGDRGPPDAVEVEPRAVVLHFDQDVRALVKRPDGDLPALGLAGRQALVGCLDPVIDGVAQQVEQRIGHLLEQRLVERHVLALDGEIDELSAALARRAHGALELRRERAERHHAELHRLVLDLTREAPKPRQVAVEVADGGGDTGADGGDVAGRFGQLARQQVKLGIAIEFQFVKAVAAGRSRRASGAGADHRHVAAERADFVV